MQERDARSIDLTLEPLDDYVVIQPSDEESETNLGLIIPASMETDCRTGVVTLSNPRLARPSRAITTATPSTTRAASRHPCCTASRSPARPARAPSRSDACEHASRRRPARR